MESNQRYYSRRAVEERMAAQRAVTETARAWHSKLAADFAERASACAATICGTAILNGCSGQHIQAAAHPRVAPAKSSPYVARLPFPGTARP